MSVAYKYYLENSFDLILLIAIYKINISKLYYLVDDLNY